MKGTSQNFERFLPERISGAEPFFDLTGDVGSCQVPARYGAGSPVGRVVDRQGSLSGVSAAGDVFPRETFLTECRFGDSCGLNVNW